jgi:hypothetical protein
MTQLKTVQEPMKLLLSTNLTNVAVSSLGGEGPTTTLPATTGSSAVIPTATLNYVKIIPVFNTTTAYAGQVIRVTGYTKTAVGEYYVPQLLFYGTVVTMNSAATALTLNSVSMYPVSTMGKTEGDAKIYNATTSKSTASLLVDTLGCQYVKVEFAATSAAGQANAFIGAI